MDVVSRGITGAFGIAAKRMECQCYHGVASGCVNTLLSVLTDTVGKADGIILMLLGSACTDGRIWLLLCLSLIYIFLYSMILYISTKDPKRRIPYIPFLLIAYITTWII